MHVIYYLYSESTMHLNESFMSATLDISHKTIQLEIKKKCKRMYIHSLYVDNPNWVG